MAFINIGELVDDLQKLEDALNRFYAEVRDKTGNSNVKMLTYFLAKRKSRLPRICRDFGADCVERVRLTELKNYRKLHFPSSAGMGFPPDNVGAQQLIDAAMMHGKELIGVYAGIQTPALSGEAREFFQRLTREEEADLLKLREMKNMSCFKQ